MADITSIPWGKTESGEEVSLFTLRNDNGVTAKVTNYGARLVSLLVPDRDGNIADVNLGFDNLAGYLDRNPHFGSTVGRYANRIANGRFSLDGVEYQLAVNNGPNSLHGGKVGFDRRVWQVSSTADSVLQLEYVSPDGEENFPGRMEVMVAYSLTKENELRIDYRATTDKPTIFNLTNHSYFNLAGAGNGDILGHELWIDADSFTPTDATNIPTGEIRSVEGSPLDFRNPTAVGARIDADDEQLRFGHGYDHNYVLNHSTPGALDLVARVVEPKSGRVMEVLTTEPGVQLYTGNQLDGSLNSPDGKPFIRRGALCLETQHYPDSPNQPSFPSTVLRPGDVYRQTTIYQFQTEK